MCLKCKTKPDAHFYNQMLHEPGCVQFEEQKKEKLEKFIQMIIDGELEIPPLNLCVECGYDRSYMRYICEACARRLWRKYPMAAMWSLWKSGIRAKSV